MKKAWLLICLFSVTTCAAAFGQSCMTATCIAASASEADIIAALPSSGNTNATVVVNIPSGSATWTSAESYTIPSAVTNLTIQGATTVSCTGTAGTSSYACTATDSTSVTDGVSSNSPVLQITTGASATYFTLEGLTFTCNNSSYSKYNGCLNIQGSSENIRVTGNHFVTSANQALTQENGGAGVFDHNLFDMGDNTSVSNGVRDFATVDDTVGYGDGTWATATNWGSSQQWYVEKNVFNGGAPNDCAEAAEQTIRYNTINDAYLGFQTHGTKQDAGGSRGCRLLEIYHNYFTGPSGSPANSAGSSKGGSMVIWGNTLASGYYHLFVTETDRNCCTTDEVAPPNGWGYCGVGGTGTASGSVWDGTTSPGYPCLDGIGRGQTQNALNGQYWPNRAVTATGTQTWPDQYLEPQYLWMNTLSTGDEGYIGDSVSQLNRDVYEDCGNSSSGCSAAFNGTQGTGYGLLASRPSTCTAGPGGTFGTSPTGSYGVGYWATDANSGNGELYVCSATNTWTAIYQPYTYPHPLDGGATVYSFTVASSPVGGGTFSGTNCANGSYVSGTAISCTATANSGYVFAGWVGAGSCSGMSGTGTAGCTLGADSSLTANFSSTASGSAPSLLLALEGASEGWEFAKTRGRFEIYEKWNPRIICHTCDR